MTDKDQGKASDFKSLTENLSQQQAKISALKELVRQSESQQGRNTASAQEKVKNIAQRLSNLKSKASKSKLHRASSEVSDDYSITHFEEDEHESSSSSSNIPHSTSLRARSETPGSEKITLLRQQMELNRVKMAERENKSKEIEQMVTQLKSKFETSQMSLERSVELGRSMGDLSNIPSMLVNTHRSVTNISQTSQPLNLENERIKFLEKRIRDLETIVTNKENESETEVVQSLGRKILDLEENLREKESIIDARTRAVSLLSENLTKKKKDVVDSLEETKQEMFKMQETFLDAEMTYKNEVDKLSRVILDKSAEISNLNEKCEILEKSRYDLTIENSELKGKLEDVQDYSTKISELNKLNETLQKRISTLESQRYEIITDDEVAAAESKDIVSEKIKELEEMLQNRNEEFETLEESLQEKTIEVNVINANMAVLQEKYNSLGPRQLFPSDSNISEESQAEISKLKQQLEESNKSMIKTKLKMKQMQKQIDSLQKSSDGSQEISRLTDEIQNLNQRIAELEEEKGSYQLQLVGKDNDSEIEKKLKVLETTCQNQNTAIQLLEEQKMEMNDELIIAKKELAVIKENPAIDELKCLNEELEQRFHQLSDEKEELTIKMNRYLNENMELLDKLEKLSKGSSAESIEMVANLTVQEKLEIEQYQKERSHKDDEIPIEISQDLNESLRSLRMESSELMEKIELFTVERREVLGKLDALTIENQVLEGNLENVKEQKEKLEDEVEVLKAEKEEFEETLRRMTAERNEMSERLTELSDHRTKLQEEINKLVKEELTSSQSSPSKTSESSEQASQKPIKETESTFDREACEKLLKQLDSEIQNLNKNKDKNQKLKISKKLSDNAKNVHAMMTNLLIEFYKNLDDCKQLRDDLEKVKILLNNVSSDKNNEEVQNLKSQLEEKVNELTNKSQECESLQNKLIDIQNSNNDAFSIEIEQLKSNLEKSFEQCNEKDEFIVKLQASIDNLTTERDRCESEVQKQMLLISDLRKEFDQLCADLKVNNKRLNEKSLELDQLQHEFDMKLKTSTNEVEILKTLVAEQKQLLIDAYQEHELDINQKIKEINDHENQIKQMSEEIETLKNQSKTNQELYSNDLKIEIDKMKNLLTESNKEIEFQKEELLHKQETIDTLNTQIIDLYKSMEENSNKLIEKEDELQYLQEIADSNREEIRNAYEKISKSERMIEDLRNQLSSKAHQIEVLQQKPTIVHDSKAEERIKQLEAENNSLEMKNKEQHDKLKKFAANLKKKQVQCTELEAKVSNLSASSVDSTDSAQVNELRAKVIQYEEQLNNIKSEKSKLNESVQKSAVAVADEIEDLKWKIDEYESMINDKTNQISNLQSQLELTSKKCDQIEEYSFELQSQIQKLETDKNQLLASANTVNELTQQLHVIQKEKNDLIEKLQGSETKDKSEERKKMEKLKSTAVQLKHKLTEKKKEVEDLTTELETLKSSINNSSSQDVENLKTHIKELNEKNDKILSDTKTAYDNDISVLKEKILELESSNNILMEEKQRKVSLEGQLETFEMTNIELREKVARLEEAVATLDSEKEDFLRVKLLLERDLEEKGGQVDRKLHEQESENHQLKETIKALNEERTALLQKFSLIELQIVSNAETSRGQVSCLENDNSQLQQQVQNQQIEMKKLQQTHDQAITAKHAEIDEMEAQFSSQMQKIESEKKTIQEALEKANDQIVDFQDEVIRLKDNTHSLEQARADLERELSWLKLQNDNYTQDQLEIEQLRMQLMQSETELENLRTQNEAMASNHDAEVLILRQQISDLEAMRSQVSQNQTDDQVMLQNENVKLKEMLIEKENEIHQKITQYHMASVFDAPIESSSDPFANLMASPPSSTSNESKTMEEKLKQAYDEMERMRETQMMANMEMDIQSGRIHELLNENQKLKDKTQEMQSIMDNLIRTNVELEAVTERQKDEVVRKEKEISEIKIQMDLLRDNFSHTAQSTDDDKLHPLQSELIEKNRIIENLQNILQKYELQEVAHHQPTRNVAPQAPTQALSTSMFFGDPQPSTSSSLFDDPFSAVDISMQPIVEEEIKPKKAYVCFDSMHNIEIQTEERWMIEHNENINQVVNLQNQLLSMEQKIMEQYVELENQRHQICQLEANQKHKEEIPLTEPEVVTKKAYLCYENSNENQTQTDYDFLIEYQNQFDHLHSQIKHMEERHLEQSLQIENYVRRISELEVSTQRRHEPLSISLRFDSPEQIENPMAALEIEDGWGWGSENAAAVSEIQQQQHVAPLASLLSPRSDLEVKLQEQIDNVEKLEQEKNVLNEELVGLRENSKKMIKKLKDYQLRIKELETNARRSSSVEMDLVIQEELNSQVQRLETKLKELSSEREKEQQEKEALVKKFEVVSNANERMVEMKERQDNQMEMYQLKIKDLSQKLHNLEEWGDDNAVGKSEIVSKPADTSNQEESIQKIQELTDQIKDMQVDYDELQALLDEEKNNCKILEDKVERINKEQELSKNDEISQLNHQVQVKNFEIQELISKIDLLSHESVNIRAMLDDLRSQVQQKTNENQQLNDRLQKMEVNKSEISHERQLYNESIEQNLRQQIHDLESQIQSMQGEMEYKNAQIAQLHQNNADLLKESDDMKAFVKNVSLKEEEINQLKIKLNESAISVERPDDLQNQYEELKKVNSELNKEKGQMEHELQVLNDQVLASLEFEDRMKNIVLELDAKNMEIQMLKATLSKVQSQSTNEEDSATKELIETLRHEKEEVERSMKSSIDLLNAQWSQLVEQRGNEVANSWKQHLEMRETEFAEIEASLRAQFEQKLPLQSTQEEKVENNDTLIKMKSIMESQEVEIVSLKEQLAIRSAEYAALSAKVDPYHQMSTSMNVSPIPQDSDKVPRSELDLALYMLHQRDMRLEEMTMELVRLLEERDTLQLRLSNAIRQIEDTKKKFNIEPESSDQSTPEKSPPVLNVEDDQLKAKLSELNTIKHSRDKTITEDRETRFMNNISMFQRDVANIPQEAAARIVAGSDQNQSPSSVLMNWILGKNPESS